MSEVGLYVWEFISRRDFLGVYLLTLGLAFVWFAAHSRLSLEARAFGFRAPEVRGRAAGEVGAAWLAIALLTLTGALLLLLGVP